MGFGVAVRVAPAQPVVVVGSADRAGEAGAARTLAASRVRRGLPARAAGPCQCPCLPYPHRPCALGALRWAGRAAAASVGPRMLG